MMASSRISPDVKRIEEFKTLGLQFSIAIFDLYWTNSLGFVPLRVSWFCYYT